MQTEIEIDDDDEEPLFDSVDQACAALGWSAEQKEIFERHLAESIFTRKGETLH